MATAIITAVRDVDIPYSDRSENYDECYATWTVNTDDYAAGGIALDFSGLFPHSSLPVEVYVWDEDVAQTYFLKWIPGTTQANGKVAMFQITSSVLAQITGGMPAAISSSTELRFRAKFVKGK